jgi:murein DD-endopeptidase MepM/ murein hydrolase activator NlpD
MDKEYFAFDVTNSLNGKIKRVRISYRSAVYTLIGMLLIAVAVVGLGISYLWMSRRVSNYERLQSDFSHLRTQYAVLQHQVNQHERQMASLETLATEVSVAYGINQPADLQRAEPLDADSVPNLRESLEQYTFLQSASFSQIYHHYAYKWQVHNEPSLWPVIGVVRSTFGGRSDPFNGEGAFHTGIDLQAPTGSAVHVTADGVVETMGWSGNYGKLVVVNHGNGLETYYGHLSHFLVVPGQEVRRGEVIALSGSTGRATGPHVHYEVRLSGTPVNPYRFMAKATPVPRSLSSRTHNDLGL